MNRAPYDFNLGLRFERVVEAYAQRTALWFGSEQQVGYEELGRRSNRMARQLVELGVRRADVVCLSGDKTPELFAAILGCLKIGAIYCVLDPDGPAERQARIIETCRPRAVVGDAEFLDRNGAAIRAGGALAVRSDELANLMTGGASSDADLPETRAVTGSDPAYIMFTSGSTGIPKGAVMTHANVGNLIDWARTRFSISETDILTNVNPMFFDNSVFDTYASLFNGACLVPFSKAEVRDPRTLVDKVDDAACTLWFSVPSLLIFLQTMHAADGQHLRSIRRFVFGGEGYPKAKLIDLFEKYSASSELINVYGPTECTCICSAHTITAADFDDMHTLPVLGHISDNFAHLVTGEDGRATEPGAAGELCLLGPGVGLGYYNDPERTALAFVPSPRTAYREVMYRTGDLVREDPSTGVLSILGRRDNQIKHMGYRIELEEVESALNRLAYVSEAAAVYARNGAFGRIVAIVATDGDVDPAAMRSDLGRLIPDYMIPAAFYARDRLPKNANGKIDRVALAAEYGTAAGSERA